MSRRPHAFSLVELIIAIAVLTVGLLGAIRAFPVGLKASKRSELVSRAALAAQRTLESLKLRGWDGLAPGTTTSSDAPFEVAVTIDAPPAGTGADPDRLKRVTVDVRWTQDGRTRSLPVVTYLRRPSS
jgi:prepilin-type N-terminal cleavage/methylation domain-containing protein